MVICYSCKGELIHWCLPGVSVEGRQVVTRSVLAPPSRAHSQGVQRRVWTAQQVPGRPHEETGGGSDQQGKAWALNLREMGALEGWGKVGAPDSGAHRRPLVAVGEQTGAGVAAHPAGRQLEATAPLQVGDNGVDHGGHHVACKREVGRLGKI